MKDVSVLENQTIPEGQVPTKARRIVVIAVLVVIVFGALGVLRVKWLGFRASSPPAVIEASMARSLCNFAIPSPERNRTNPFTNDEVALEEG